jgi:hypothetical protein
LEAIRATLRDGNRRWYGVNFEEAIPFLVERVKTFANEMADI